MTERLDGRELLAIRARAARAHNGLHQSLRQTEQDREALLREVYRLRALLPRTPDSREEVERRLAVTDSPADARTDIPGTPGTREAPRDPQEGS